MSGILYLIPIALLLGVVGLAAFLWALKSGQYDDLDGAVDEVRRNLEAHLETVRELFGGRAG